MTTGKRRFAIGLVAMLFGIVIAFCLALMSINDRVSAPKQAIKADIATTPSPPVVPDSTYAGTTTLVATAFSVKVPDNWRASISENPSFLAIMFARPNQLASLTYSPGTSAVIDHDGIPSWSGLTEHFFVLAPTPAQQFTPHDHLEVSSEPFTFDDGTVGQKYYVVKHATEAQKWGGLQRDTEWQGRTYIYEKDGKRVEAHLALYPSSAIDIPFYESMVRTISIP